ncbi:MULTISPECIES: efflux RND transporter periplasmic adaptor subunit [Methylomonas]|uniref:Efflux transporter periplasmic adaptor subunit n=2 Tax=Methylomonas TaxID=416 RepID=A0A140E7F1_9GAMM|nr:MULTISPECIES: efflux RND transporter periplasmic adaptor subunit [Methylomonas]AMK79325.1 efflux transporter periplasmic adaptor subunit [Methylomonas denitrificans]OAI03248.1 efflux transporter periplasmic adaptor subunit [Methylomonas methanica]TCV86154.1 cobalt-zinc-cadmium efflux system membrane fusion protein [Methylomonas methanica]
MNNITKKQLIAIASIILIGVLLSILILGIDKTKSEADEQVEESHADAKAQIAQGDDHRELSDETKQTQDSGGGAALHEGEFVALTDQQIAETGISIQTAGAAHIKTLTTLPGEIRFNEDKTSHVVPRLAGVVEHVSANLGQQVKKGQVIAVIASTALSEQRSELLSAQKRLELARNTFAREKHLWEAKISAEQDYLQAQQAMREMEIAVQNAQQKLIALGASPTVSANTGALNRYEIRAPFDGMVVEKHIALGEAVKEDTSIFTISDLSTVWADIIVSANDLNLVRVGAKVSIKATALESTASGTVSYVGSLMGEQTRTATARVTLDNPDMVWRPGLFITVDLIAKETEVSVAVSADTIQTINDKPAIFIRVPGGFIAQPVTTGLSDGKVTEIMAGLKPGTEYAVNGSFLLKSEQGKGASDED